MNFLNNARIGVRLGLAFAFVLSLTVFLGALSIVQLARVNATTAEIADELVPSAHISGELQKSLSDFRVLQYNHLFTRDPRLWEPIKKSMTDAIASMAARSKDYETRVRDDAERAIWERFKTSLVAYQKSNEELMALSEQGLKVSATEMMAGSAGAIFKSVEGEANALQKLNVERVSDARDRAASIHRSAVTGVVLAVLGALVLGAGAALTITRSMTGPIAEAVAFARKVAVGDLTSRLEVSRQDEAGDLLRALVAMNEGLARMVSEVRQSSADINAGTVAIASGNSDLSRRTERQADSLQQTASAMEQLAAAVRANSETTIQANSLAGEAASVAQRGGQVVSEVVNTMRDIAESSNRIVEIVSLIDGIAFQTNILALNAAVEAARAGEQGRGFAVVASEVRTLASRSASAAREIKALIGSSVERVESGARRSDAASAAMRDILDQVDRLRQLIAEVSAATGEQSRGVGQLEVAIGDMEQFTQQNSALVQHTAGAATSLRQQSTRLAEAVDVFKVLEAARAA